MADEIELTELTEIDVVRQDGVKTPASGWEFIIQKSVEKDACGKVCGPECDSPYHDGHRDGWAKGHQQAAKDVNAVGGIDEKPDIAGAQSVLQQLAKLIESEAREMQVCPDEIGDIHTLMEAACLMRCFLDNEMWADEDDGSMMKSADGLVFKAHRKFSSDERKEYADKDWALPDGSYPIPDADALRRAAILARSGHGDVAAAKRLIAKRAKELKVPNPLDSDTQKDAPEGAQTPAADEPQVTDGSLTKEAVEQLIEDRLAQVVKDAEEREKALADELEVLKATPIPGLAMTATAAQQGDKAKGENLAKAAYHDRLAEATTGDLAKYHREKADAARKAADL